MKRYLPIIAVFITINTYSQQDSLLRGKINQLITLFTDFNYQPIAFNDTSLSMIRNISKLEEVGDFPDRSAYLEKRAELLRADLGVDFVGSYIENLNLDPVEDLEENISYRRRVQFGMQWNVLDGGYLENQVRAQILEDRVERERLSNDIARESQFYLKRFDQTVFEFNQFKLQLLNYRLSELKKQYELILDLTYLKMLKKEQLIEVQVRIAEVESLINIYESYNDYLGIQTDSLSSPSEFPLIELNYDVIFKQLGIQTDSLSAANNYVEYFKWYHQIGLRPFMRYNHYDIITDPNRSYFSAGVNVIVPLSFNTALENEVAQEKWKYENQRLTNDRAELHEEVLNTAYEFRYQMKRFIDAYQQRKLVSERLRIEKAKMRLSDVKIDPFKGLELYDELIISDIELIESLQGLYLKALKIQTKIPGTSIDAIVKNQPVEDFYSTNSFKTRSIYVWSKIFEENKGDFLAEYAIYNEFGKLIVAVSDKDTSEEKKLFLQYAAENSEVYFMLGNNKLFYHKDIAGYLGDVLNNYSSTKPVGIHLDIEPHTFANWSTDKNQLQKDYFTLVRNVSVFCKAEGLKLEISVPKHYDEIIMEMLFEIVDKVYFMCYENVDTDFLVRKLGHYVNTGYSNKVVIALRTEDFENRLEMEDKMDALQKELGVNEFAYHDLQRIINFDKKERE